MLIANIVPGIKKFTHHVLSISFLCVYTNYEDSFWILLITNPAGDHFQSNMQLIGTLNLWIAKKKKKLQWQLM